MILFWILKFKEKYEKDKLFSLINYHCFCFDWLWWRKFGGGNSSSSNSETITPTTPVITTQTLSFIDDKVSGVKYVNGTNSGFTDANGQFPYTSGTVEFYLGDIKLGSLSSIPTDKNVFIQDILGIDRTDTSNAKVLKIPGPYKNTFKNPKLIEAAQYYKVIKDEQEGVFHESKYDTELCALIVWRMLKSKNTDILNALGYTEEEIFKATQY